MNVTYLMLHVIVITFREDFMAGHVLSRNYKYMSRPHMQKGVRREKLLLILTSWGEHPNFL
jgi:hypothetical protein